MLILFPRKGRYTYIMKAMHTKSMQILFAEEKRTATKLFQNPSEDTNCALSHSMSLNSNKYRK
jgi:uncharacterized membrane protein (UPF0127 family)